MIGTSAIAAMWRGEVVGPYLWARCANQTSRPGEAGGFEVECEALPGRRGYMKPRKLDAGARIHARAAREKICSDLAYDLGVNVPPVVLAERSDAPSTEERNVCVSLFMYPLQEPWIRCKQHLSGASNPFQDLIRRDLPTAGAFAFALDTWVCQTDHNDHPANIQWGWDLQDRSRHGLVFLDYAFSLGIGDGWHNGRFAKYGEASFPAVLRSEMAKRALHDAVQRVESFPEVNIQGIVGRIPDHYMSREEKGVVIQGLVERRALVRSNLRAYL